MARTPYTIDEVVLCAYAARYDGADFGGMHAIHRLQGRSLGSIRMKIQNIAAMLDEEAIGRYSDVSPLSGRPPGEDGRRTNWDLVSELVKLSRSEFLSTCREIVDGAGTG